MLLNKFWLKRLKNFCLNVIWLVLQVPFLHFFFLLYEFGMKKTLQVLPLNLFLLFTQSIRKFVILRKDSIFEIVTLCLYLFKYTSKNIFQQPHKVFDKLFISLLVFQSINYLYLFSNFLFFIHFFE